MTARGSPEARSTRASPPRRSRAGREMADADKRPRGKVHTAVRMKREGEEEARWQSAPLPLLRLKVTGGGGKEEER